MNTTDIDPTAPPGEKRCTSHVFRTDASFRAFLSAGVSLSLSNTLQDPPAILFDAIYASTVLHHFGTQSLKDLVTTIWKDTFYPGGVMTTTQADYKEVTAGQAAALENKQKHDQERDTRHEGRHEPDTYDMLMILPYCMIPPNELQEMLREAKEKAEAVERRCVQEKVDVWKQGTAV